MVCPPGHPQAGEPKGMRDVIKEHGLWWAALKMKCDPCQTDSNDCCASQILARQPDFREQHSLVQEVIEAAGHICVFLPKYHCNYTFKTLQANLPKAMASVPITTIQKWENQTWQWIDAYRGGLDAKDAQMQVKAFSSRVYSSHRRTSECIGQQFDTL